MKVYLQNGIEEEIYMIYNGDSPFYVQEFKGKYIYPNDTIRYSIDEELVKLYDSFRDLFFSDPDMYYKELSFVPIFVQQAGQDSDCAITKNSFLSFLENERFLKTPNIYKYLYLVDCQYLIGSIQNLLDGMEYSFTNFYVKLSDLSQMVFPDETEDNTWLEMSSTARYVTSLLESYFIKAYSILDMFCKIAYEIEFKMTDFSIYNKMKSSDVLWGKRKKLKVNKTPKTVFEECELISIIESLRNEVVHNVSWELNPKIFTVFKNDVVTERFVLFPDMSEGHLAKVKNRKHFFGEGIKVNEIFPKLHFEYLSRVLETTKVLNNYCIGDVAADFTAEINTN